MSTSYLDSYMLVSQARNTLERLMNVRLKSFGLTITQFHMLELLVKNKAILPAHFAQHLGISAAGVTTVVDQLERRQLLERLRNQPDRRTVRLQVTPDGAQTHSDATAALTGEHPQAHRALPPSYFTALNTLLKAL